MTAPPLPFPPPPTGRPSGGPLPFPGAGLPDPDGAQTPGQPAPPPEPPPLVLLAPVATPEDADRVRRALQARFGDAFPLARLVTADALTGAASPPTDADWCGWIDATWAAHEPVHLPAVRRAQRNRLVRDGLQWIASYQGGPWTVPPRPANKVRAVVNMIGPALDWRLQIQTEQRPGVHVVPMTRDPEDQQRAQASNAFLEYQYRVQRFGLVRREAARWAQTDGVSFLYRYWDPEAGPLLRDPDQGTVSRAGECATRVLTLEQVRVSANATATVAPRYWIVSEDLPLAEAVAEFGDGVTDERGSGGGRGTGLTQTATARDTGSVWRRPDVDQRLDGQRTVRKRMLFCAPCDVLPNGLACVVVGRTVVACTGLLGGVVPVSRYADGTSDPAFYGAPQMDLWLDAQMRLNKAYSLLLQNLATNAGGRFAYRQGVVKPDTLAGGQDMLIEVRSASALADVLLPMQGFSIGQDAMTVIQAEIKTLEDLTGYNDVARGGVSSQSSGKAVYAIREQIERVFAASVYAECEGVKDWAQGTLALAATCYQVPRAIRMLGKGRPDLGRLITGADLDGAADIDLDPETLMPTPASVKRAQLDDLFAKGLVKPHEYVRRYGYGVLDGIEYADETQASRAYRYVDAVQQDSASADAAEPMLWPDDEGIWQEILERTLILAPDIPPDQRAVALDRWTALAHQALEKAGASPTYGAIPSPLDPMDPSRAALAAPPAPPPPMAAPQGAPSAGAPVGPGTGPSAAPISAGPPAAGSAAPATPTSLPPDQAPTGAMPPGPVATPPTLAALVSQQMAARLHGVTPS